MAQYANYTAFLSLNAQSATSAVPGFLDNVEPRPQHSLFVVAGAGVSAGVVAIQISNDGVNWSNPGASAVSVTTSAPGAYAINVANFPAQYVRAAITTTITGGTVTAYVASA